MKSTFWIQSTQLDKEQRQAVETVPEGVSFLLTGPAGSGKTNILLLRAKWLALKNLPDIKLVVFTSSLKQFVAAGCEQYGLDTQIVTTQMTFFRTILEEYGVPHESTGDFETDRNSLAGKVMSLVESKKVTDSYVGSILVDESQDYTDTELIVFRGLTKRLVLASDSRQSIYRVTHTPGLPEKLVSGNVRQLKYHYRSGLNLCKVADAVLAKSSDYPSLQGESRYPEAERPSSVTPVSCASPEAQHNSILENLKLQLPLYPDEILGVLFPKREQADAFSAFIQLHPMMVTHVRIDTLHRAKGWEFRAVHLGGCEVLYKMGPVQKRLIYTGILRGKTSAHVYFSGHIPGYLESALAVLGPPAEDPKIDDLF